MIGEYFLDECLVAACSVDNKEHFLSEIIQTINSIIQYYKKEYSQNSNEVVPIDLKEKVEIIEFIVKERLTKKRYNFDSLMERLKKGKYKGYIDVLQDKHRDLKAEDINEFRELLGNTKKLIDVLSNKNEIETLLADINSENYTDTHDVISKWETVINKSHNQIMKVNNVASLKDATRISFLNDDYRPILIKLKESTDLREITKTGFENIDKCLPSGGFEKRRLYLVGGTSGVGKSLILTNFISNVIKYKYVNNEIPKEKETYLYITAENLIHEAFNRFYCSLTGTSSTASLYSVKNDDFNVYSGIKNVLNTVNSDVIFQYISPRTSKVSQVESIIAQAVDQCNGNIKGVYLDYLDLISYDDTGISTENVRLCQGYVSQMFKNIAVTYNIPFITATQLNRNGYNKDTDASLTQMGESMMKVDNSDFVLFMQEDNEPNYYLNTPQGQKHYVKIRLKVLKNRNGMIGDTFYLYKPMSLNNVNIFNFSFEELGFNSVSNVNIDMPLNYENNDEGYIVLDDNCITQDEKSIFTQW